MENTKCRAYNSMLVKCKKNTKKHHASTARKTGAIGLRYEFLFVSTYTRTYCYYMYNAEIFFTIPWKSGMSPYICVWLCVNEISFDLKGSGNVSPMEETRRLGQISSYQRISSLDVVRVKPNKKYKLIFTVIICCLELLCWTRSPF